jgi:hypothetical protein
VKQPPASLLDLCGIAVSVAVCPGVFTCWSRASCFSTAVCWHVKWEWCHHLQAVTMLRLNRSTETQ